MSNATSPGDTKQPHQYFGEAMEHLAANPEGCQCKPIPACVAHYALQAMHNDLVVQPYLRRQRGWWRRLWAALRPEPHPLGVGPWMGQGYGSNL